MSDILKAWTIAIGAGVSFDLVRNPDDQVLTLIGSIILLVLGCAIAIYGSTLAISVEPEKEEVDHAEP